MKISRRIASLVFGMGTLLRAQTGEFRIDATNWGSVTAPVYNMGQAFFGAGPELFTGPNQWASYYNGVLPNGRFARPAGVSVPVGMNPLGMALTPDGKFLVTSNNNERDSGIPSLKNTAISGGYSLTVIETATMTMTSQIYSSGNFYVGLQITSSTGNNPYRVWASAGPDNTMRLFTISSTGIIARDSPATIAITPITPGTAGYVSNYTPGAAMNATDSRGFRVPVPTGFTRTGAGAKITFPAGSALSPDGKFLYVACNGDNSVAVIDTTALKVVRQVPVGYFPFSVSVNKDGDKVLVSNWGITEYKFLNPEYDASGNLISIGAADGNQPEGFYVPDTDTGGLHPKTSSISILRARGGNGATLARVGAIYQGKPLDDLYQVGDTHPSATAIVRNRSGEVLYVTKSNSDSLGLINLEDNTRLPDVDLSPVSITLKDGHAVHGSYPNALAVSADGTRVYVAEMGIVGSPGTELEFAL